MNDTISFVSDKVYNATVLEPICVCGKKLILEKSFFMEDGTWYSKLFKRCECGVIVYGWRKRVKKYYEELSGY